MTQKLTRWRKEAVRDVKLMDPDQLLPVLFTKRFRHSACLDAYLDRIEKVIVIDSSVAISLAEKAPRFAESISAETNESVARAWALKGSTLRIQGDLHEAELCLKHAVTIVPDDSLEAPAIWCQVAALRADQSRVKEGLDQISRAISFLRDCKSPKVNSCERFSVSTMLIYQALLEWREGRSYSRISETLLSALKESSDATPLARDLAAQNLAAVGVLGWMAGEAGFHPKSVLTSINKVHKMLNAERHPNCSPCRARLYWAEGLALAQLSQGLTKAAEAKLGAAKACLNRIGAKQDIVLLDFDFCYWYIRENRLTKAAGIAEEALQTAIALGYQTEILAAIRQWLSSLKEGTIPYKMTEEIFKKVRGVTSISFDHQETDPSIESEQSLAGRWYSDSGW